MQYTFQQDQISKFFSDIAVGDTHFTRRRVTTVLLLRNVCAELSPIKNIIKIASKFVRFLVFGAQAAAPSILFFFQWG